MSVVLARLRQTVDGMFGEISLNGEPLCVTVERPWKDNKPQISCIPPGEYLCVAYKHPTKGNVWLLKDVPGQKMVMIQPASVSTQLKSGIAPGKSFAHFSEFEHMQGVTSSRFTMLMLERRLPREFTLTILDPQ